MTDKQLGRFTVDGAEVRRSPEKTAEVFALMKCVPVRCEYLWAGCTLAYTAVSELFRGLTEGEEIPFYRLTVHVKDGVVERVEAEEEKGA
jgi:hypothetical protein